MDLRATLVASTFLGAADGSSLRAFFCFILPVALGACFSGLAAFFAPAPPALPPFFFDAASSLRSILAFGRPGFRSVRVASVSKRTLLSRWSGAFE